MLLYRDTVDGGVACSLSCRKFAYRHRAECGKGHQLESMLGSDVDDWVRVGARSGCLAWLSGIRPCGGAQSLDWARRTVGRRNLRRSECTRCARSSLLDIGEGAVRGCGGHRWWAFVLANIPAHTNVAVRLVERKGVSGRATLSPLDEEVDGWTTQPKVCFSQLQKDSGSDAVGVGSFKSTSPEFRPRALGHSCTRIRCPPPHPREALPGWVLIFRRFVAAGCAAARMTFLVRRMVSHGFRSSFWISSCMFFYKANIMDLSTRQA